MLLTPQDVDRVFGLVALVADPKGSKQRLDAIMAAHGELEKAKAEHIAASKAHEASRTELMKAREAHAAELTKAQAEHDAALAKARAAHDGECAVRRQALDERERELIAREANVKRAGEVAAAVKAAFEKRAAHLDAALRG